MAGDHAGSSTIAAIATPPGYGGVGIIRLSGPAAVAIAKAMLGQCPKPRYALFCEFKDPSSGQCIDKGIALYFKAPHSFTGQDVLELQAHGGPVILDRLLAIALSSGARLAEPGEFSKVAFLNHKIDLAQAEAVADMINATSQQAATGALRSMQGEFSRQIKQHVQQLVRCRMQVEASIDFPDEDIDLIAESTVLQDCDGLSQAIRDLLSQAQQGAMMQEGITVVIAGKPNAGKSSLLNALSGEDTAIVTERAGTTRDVLRQSIHIDGLPLHVVDTAGLRDAEDVVEQEGIRRAWQQIEKADMILLLVDASAGVHIDQELQPFLSLNTPIIVIKNKIDLTREPVQVSQQHNCPMVSLSITAGLGLLELKQLVKQVVGYQPSSEGNFIARRRHVDALQRGLAAIESGVQHYHQQCALELFAEDLRIAQLALSEITGEFHSDDLLGQIFSSFCIGK